MDVEREVKEGRRIENARDDWMEGGGWKGIED